MEIFRTLCAGMRIVIGQARALATLVMVTLAGCLAPESPNGGGGANADANADVNVYVGDTGSGDTDTAADADTDTDTDSDSDSDSDSDTAETGDTSDTSETGETGETGDSGGDTADTGLDTAGETGDTGGDTGPVDTAGDTAGDTASDTGNSGADTASDTAADTADTGIVLPEVPWYRDADGDGYGDSGDSVSGTTAPSGYVADSTDCDDSDATVNPAAEELPVNGVDDNCDGGDSDLIVSGYHGEVTTTGITMPSHYDEWVWFGASLDSVNDVEYTSTDLPSALDSADVLEVLVTSVDVSSTYAGHSWLEYNLEYDSNGDGVEETWPSEGCDGWSFTITATEASATVGVAYAYDWVDGSGLAYGNCSLYLEGSTPSGSDVGQTFEFSVP